MSSAGSDGERNVQVGWPGGDCAAVFDLSQPVTDAMARWHGTERSVVAVDELDIDHDVEGGRVSVTHLSTPAHAGTHIDAARHFYPHGKTIDQYGPGRFVTRALAIDVRRQGPVPLGGEELRALDPGIAPGDAVLLYFGYAERYEEPEYYEHPYLGEDAAGYLVERGVSLVGVDLLTPDLPGRCRPPRFAFPVHSQLLSADILVMENLGPALAQLVGLWFLLVCAPLPLHGGDGSPVAPIALLGDGEPFGPPSARRKR